MKKRIGVISDIHGNASALKAILLLLEQSHCDEIVHTGDIVDIGCNSKECLEILLSDPKYINIRGNHDNNYLFDRRMHLPKSHVSEAHKSFVFDSIGDKYKSAVAAMPKLVIKNIGGVRLAFCHYALYDKADSDAYMFLPIVPPSCEAFDEMFANIDADAVFFGHKHEPCDITGKKVYVDVGSVACHENDKAWAVIIDADENGWSYTRTETVYDRKKFDEEMIASGLPDARYMLNFYYDHTV